MKSFELWDNFSVVHDASTRSALYGAANLILLTQSHEIKMLQRLLKAGGGMVYNGAPATKSWTQAFRASDALYVAETGEQCRVRFQHLSTPIALTKDMSQTNDVDPKYQATCNGTHDVTTCVSDNVIANLDFGVLSCECSALRRSCSLIM
jgi:hypothetical protein